jgi:hypothetical protein
VKSYPADYPWLAYALRSIHKFCSGFSEIVVLIPDDSNLHLTQEKVVKVKEPGPHATSAYEHGVGYVAQQLFKVKADKYTDADQICHVDSDVIFTRPVTPNDLMVDGKPLWLMTPMAETIAGDKNCVAHATAMERFFGEVAEFDFMRRHSQIIPRWGYACFRDFVQNRHGMSFDDWALKQPFRGCTEFNFLGMVFYKYYRNFFHFHDTRFGIPESFVLQKWSYGGLTQEIKDEFEAILA